MGFRNGCCGLALASVLALSGCGGGDGGPSGPAFMISPAEPGAQPETETEGGGEASSRAPAILARIDAVFATTVHEETGAGERAAHDTDCSGARCRSSGGGGFGIDVGTLGWLARAPVISQSGSFEVVSGSAQEAESFGAWMQHGAAGLLLERVGDSGGLSEVRYALAGGELSRVREGRDISGTWRGRMVGVSQVGGFVEGRLSGDATLTYLSTAPLGEASEDGDVVGRVEAAFTNIAGLNGGRSYADVRFDRVPVRAIDVEHVEVGGVDAIVSMPGADPQEIPTEAEAALSFEAGLSGNRIRGAFFGPERAEVGGVFERNGIVGAFGATRD